ncbi:MAG: hypothetical protein R3185_02130 [Candidatus Thermoplasmatota archaeon]|nr:hypothetical protein [Candidatus Thermoplasmatota archaeon]
MRRGTVLARTSPAPGRWVALIQDEGGARHLAAWDGEGPVDVGSEVELQLDGELARFTPSSPP